MDDVTLQVMFGTFDEYDMSVGITRDPFSAIVLVMDADVARVVAEKLDEEGYEYEAKEMRSIVSKLEDGAL